MPTHHPAETAEMAREIETEEVGATNPTTAEEVAQEVPSPGIPRHTVVTVVLTPRAAEEGEVVEEEEVETEVESGRGIEVQTVPDRKTTSVSEIAVAGTSRLHATGIATAEEGWIAGGVGVTRGVAARIGRSMIGVPVHARPQGRKKLLFLWSEIQIQ